MESMNHDTEDETSIKISILSLLRLSIGNMESGPATDEEKDLVEKAYELRNDMRSSMGDKEIKMIVALVASSQVLEDILCHYESDMPDVLSAVICKLSHHGSQHMDLEDNPLQQIKPEGTVH